MRQVVDFDPLDPSFPFSVGMPTKFPSLLWSPLAQESPLRRAKGKAVVYASFNPAPRLPRNSTPLAVSMKADLAWLSVGPT